jgi:hypothetical protein
MHRSVIFTYSVFIMSWLTIVLIAVYDWFLVIASKYVIMQAELNPVGRWLLKVNHGDISLFLAVKVTGTVIVAAILIVLFESRPRLGLSVCIGIAAVQLGLLAWLMSR